MMSSAGSLADGVLMSFLPTKNIRKVRGYQKGTDTKGACQRLMLHPYITAT